MATTFPKPADLVSYAASAPQNAEKKHGHQSPVDIRLNGLLYQRQLGDLVQVSRALMRIPNSLVPVAKSLVPMQRQQSSNFTVS
jgi:hypothetical protein